MCGVGVLSPSVLLSVPLSISLPPTMHQAPHHEKRGPRSHAWHGAAAGETPCAGLPWVPSSVRAMEEDPRGCPGGSQITERCTVTRGGAGTQHPHRRRKVSSPCSTHVQAQQEPSTWAMLPEKGQRDGKERPQAIPGTQLSGSLGQSRCYAGGRGDQVRAREGVR